jgi:hypothetical protein
MVDEDAKEMIELLRSINGHLSTITHTITDAPPPAIDPQQSYSREQTARLLGVSVWTVDRARKDGSLVETRRIGQRDVRITGESILEFHQAVRRSPVCVLRL